MSDPQSNRRRLEELVAEVLRLPAAEIVDSLDMAETGSWDSLSHMELIAAIEDEFEIELSLDDIVAMTSFGKIGDVLRARSLAV